MGDVQTVLLRLGPSMVLGGIARWERQAKREPGGFGPLSTVCIGNPLFVVLSLDAVIMCGTPESWGSQRSGAATIQGIAFLGAGTVASRGGQ
jgi:uncharacterized membrane protein YhiD involved in acid resistance